MNSVAVPRKLIIFAIVLPIAALVGYQLATPDNFRSIGIVGMVLVVLCIPILLRWHHPLLILSWNSSISLFFLPGALSLWMIMALASATIALFERAMNREKSFLYVPSTTWPLILFAGVILVTAKLRGGIGIRSLGGEAYGGKGYITLLLAIMGYFAFTSQQIPAHRANWYVSLFLLSGVTMVVSNLAYVAGPAFWWLFYLFPVDVAMSQVMADFVIEQQIISRLSGLAFSAMAAFTFLLMRYGIRGIFDLSRPWRLLAFVLIAVSSLFGGFRSIIVLMASLFLVQFYLEGLFRTRLFFFLLLTGVVLGAALIPIAHKLPLAVQRSICFLPLDWDPVAKRDAVVSLEWRVEMWRVVAPEIPKYLVLGKGYVINPADMYLAQESARRGLASGSEGAIVTGDYHSGPLSILIPFGIWGVMVVVWFWIASVRVLYLQFRYGEPRFRNINTFFLAYFVARILQFLFVYGAIGSDLPTFVGILGLSISINGGVRKPGALQLATAQVDESLAVVGQVSAHSP